MKRRLKKKFKVTVVIILLVVLAIMIFNKKEIPIKTTINYEITDNEESDKDVVADIFAKGMETSDYKKVLDFTPAKLKTNGKYKMQEFEFEKVLHYEEIENYIKEMSKSNIVNVYVIGKSHDNRNIYNVEIGSGNKVLMLDANMHAAESANAPILTKFLIDILNDYENNDKRTVELLKTVKIAAIPCINPDGYEVYNFGFDSIRNKDLWIYQNKESVSANHFKYNANGVDLNRNYPTQSAGLYHNDKNLISSVSLDKTTKRYKF